MFSSFQVIQIILVIVSFSLKERFLYAFPLQNSLINHSTQYHKQNGIYSISFICSVCICSWLIVISDIFVFCLQNRYPNKLIAENPFGGSIFCLIIFIINQNYRHRNYSQIFLNYRSNRYTVHHLHQGQILANCLL